MGGTPSSSLRMPRALHTFLALRVSASFNTPSAPSETSGDILTSRSLPFSSPRDRRSAINVRCVRLILGRNIFISLSPGRRSTSYFSAGATIVVNNRNRNRRAKTGSQVCPPLFHLAILNSLISHGLPRSPVIERAPLFLSPAHLSTFCTCNRYIHLFVIRFRRRTESPSTVPLRGKPEGSNGRFKSAPSNRR